MDKITANKEVIELDIVRIPAWEQFDWLRHGFSTRSGGVSTVYGESSLNLGWTKEDNPASVVENRSRFLAAVAGQSAGEAGFTLVTVRQIHSAIIRVIREEDGPLVGMLQTPEGKAVLEGDGLMTNLPGVMAAVGTADCVPVLVADVKKRTVAAFHAGWRGTVARIVEQGIAKMSEEYGSRPEDLIAAIGPSIGPCCYAVGEEVRTQFSSQFGYADELFRDFSAPGETQIYVNLWDANHRQLIDAGLNESQITLVGECTACARDSCGALRYFSHRGERGIAGRMLSVVGIAK